MSFQHYGRFYQKLNSSASPPKRKLNSGESHTTKESPACYNKLISLAKQQRLTDCLDWLECNAGITGEFALFTLSCIGVGP
jgi:hypothetical protein